MYKLLHDNLWELVPSLAVLIHSLSVTLRCKFWINTFVTEGYKNLYLGENIDYMLSYWKAWSHI